MESNFYSDRLSFEQISGIKFFSEFDEQDLETLQGIFRIHKFNKGDYVTTKGDDTQKSYFIIIEGSVHLYKKKYKGEKKHIGLFQDQQYFGEMAFLEGSSVVAETDLVVAELIWNEFYNIFMKKPEIIEQTSRNISSILSLRLKKANSHHTYINKPQNLTNTILLLK